MKPFIKYVLNVQVNSFFQAVTRYCMIYFDNQLRPVVNVDKLPVPKKCVERKLNRQIQCRLAQ